MGQHTAPWKERAAAEGTESSARLSVSCTREMGQHMAPWEELTGAAEGTKDSAHLSDSCTGERDQGREGPHSEILEHYPLFKVVARQLVSSHCSRQRQVANPSAFFPPTWEPKGGAAN
eukprot:1144780-Pelagomonas_calceolata.AAC.1